MQDVQIKLTAKHLVEGNWDASTHHYEGKCVQKAMSWYVTYKYRDRSLRGKVFSSLWSDFKGYFNVESYKNTRVLDMDKAKEYISCAD